MSLQKVKQVIQRIEASIPRFDVKFIVCRDLKRPKTGRIFIQCSYEAPCTISKEVKTWKGRKWYLSDYMTEDEIVKTCYVAFKMTIEHEIMEGFKMDGKRVFNPHTPYNILMEACQTEEYRK